MIKIIIKPLSCPVAVSGLILLISLSALIAAFASEAFLGLEPCILCVYQRWPYAIALFFSIIGLMFRKKRPVPRIMIGLSGLAFLANSAIAAYHTGVERHWWRSAVEGCSVPDFSGEAKSILENIMSAPTGNCSEIPWQDPLIGLSMANYNVLLCLGLFLMCTLSAYLLRNTHHTETGHKS